MTPQKIQLPKPLGNLLFPALLMAVWVLQSFLIDPRGEFPLSDDWMYSQSVLIFFRDHRFRFVDWQAAVSIFQILWGWLVSCIAGFSMTALRISVVILGGVSILLSYALFREFHKDRFVAFVAALLIAVNPIYLVWSHSFMTDIPFYTLSVASFLLGVRWLKYDRLGDGVFFILCVCLASLVRQLAIVIPTSLLAAVLIKQGFKKKTLGMALAAVAAVAVTLWIFKTVLQNTVGVPYMMNAKEKGVLWAIMQVVQSWKFAGTLFLVLGRTFFKVCVSLGFFMFPAILLTFLSVWPGMSKRARAAALATILVVAVFFGLLQKITGIQLPIGPETLRDFGIGPLSLSGNKAMPEAPSFFWLAYSFCGSVGAGIYCFLAGSFLIRSFRSGLFSERGEQTWPLVMAACACVFYFILLAISGHFDRYQIFYFPLILLSLLHLGRGFSWPRSRFFLTGAFLMVLTIGYFGVAGTHDYLAWNRVRWQVLHSIMSQRKIPPSEIDGGYEFNGWYLYDPNYLKVPGKNWWWVIRDTYRLSFSPLLNYELLHSYFYPKWLPYGENQILLLRRVREEAQTHSGSVGKPVYFFE